MLSVAVIIVSYNTRDVTVDCLRSVFQETADLALQVIVVDNASRDGSVEAIAREFPQVCLFANSENCGFAAANNQGLRVADTDYVLLLNPDTLVLDRAIETMIAWCEARPDVGCAGCQVLEADERIQQTCFADPTPLNQLIIACGLPKLLPGVFGGPAYAGWDRRTERDVDVVSGMFVLMPRRVLDTIGELDERFFIYAEEADLCRRVRSAGWRCVFTPAARIVHLDGGGKSTSQVRPSMYVQLQKSLLAYASKHHGRSGYAFAKAGYMLAHGIRFVVFGALSLGTGDKEMKVRVRLARASLDYHVSGEGPKL